MEPGMRTTFIAWCVFASTLTHAQQWQLPTDVDLKSAYCLRIKQTQGVFINELAGKEPRKSAAYDMVQKMTRDHNADVHRLQSYLLPRMSSLEPTGLLAATNRADADMGDMATVAKTCAPNCRQHAEPVVNMEKYRACLDSCRNEYPAAARVDSCKVVNWLPF
jgi:hypothetical protein